ncbi:SseB family protein [Oliverpabstia intestinalis]|uniref:SseB family protein n=1 Tax=Oliverpabstia intestinalis TaxID=2606633 RepID=UPI003F8C61BE
MTDHRNISTDEGLKDNERMEQAILSLQQNPTQEMLAHALTVVRRRMQAHGQLIVAVEPSVGNQQMRLQAIQTDDGKKWWAAFTSFDEELKGGGSVMSTFLTDMEKLFVSALSVDEIEGVIINPWNRTLMLDKNLIRIIRG